MLKNYVENLALDLTTSFVEVENDKAFLFNFDELQIEIKKIEKTLYFYSKITPCPEEKKEDLFSYLMKANLLGEGTGNGAIGLDNNEKFLTLTHKMPYEENYQVFKEAVEDFVNYLFYWEEEIKRFHKVLMEKIY